MPYLVHPLTSKHDCNPGQLGVIAALPHGRAGAFDDAAKRSTGFDDVAGRYTVLLQGRPRAVSAKPQNVVLAPERQEAKSRSTANHVPAVSLWYTPPEPAENPTQPGTRRGPAVVDIAGVAHTWLGPAPPPGVRIVPAGDQAATSAIFSAAADGDGLSFLKKTEKQASHKSKKSKKKKKGKR